MEGKEKGEKENFGETEILREFIVRAEKGLVCVCVFD